MCYSTSRLSRRLLCRRPFPMSPQRLNRNVGLMDGMKHPYSGSHVNRSGNSGRNSVIHRDDLYIHVPQN
jgi:hypothetical protein